MYVSWFVLWPEFCTESTDLTIPLVWQTGPLAHWPTGTNNPLKCSGVMLPTLRACADCTVWNPSLRPQGPRFANPARPDRTGLAVRGQHACGMPARWIDESRCFLCTRPPHNFANIKRWIQTHARTYKEHTHTRMHTRLPMSGGDRSCILKIWQKLKKIFNSGGHSLSCSTTLRPRTMVWVLRAIWNGPLLLSQRFLYNSHKYHHH